MVFDSDLHESWETYCIDVSRDMDYIDLLQI